jgi:hypothetical protein
MSFLYSINDAGNCFGKATAAGDLDQGLYVGRGPSSQMICTRKNSEGGQLGIPFFAEFYIDGAPADSSSLTLTVYGAKDNADDSGAKPVKPTGGWNKVGELVIPAGEFDDELRYRVPFSDSKYKWFKAAYTGGTGVSSVTAYLHKA